MAALLLLALLAGGCVTTEAAADGPEASAAEARAVQLSGRAVADFEGTERGAYGLRLRLLVRRGGRWAPMPGPERRHRTFDVAGEDGAFRFALATSALAGADSVAVAPETTTEAVLIVPVPRGAVRAPDAGGAESFALLGDALRLALPPGDLAADGLALRLRPELGVTVRWATLSREFVFERYGGDVPFNLPPVRTEVTDGGGYLFQPFDPDVLGGAEIELNAARGVTPTLIGHEYGHYVNFRMWGSNPVRYTLRNRNLREGWAIFFSFAVRAYAAARYGDAHLASSNTETAPFTHLDGLGVRYERIVYGRSKPDYAAIGALLWNLYDEAGPTPFEPAALDGDNENVGLGVEVFEAVRTARTSLLREAGIVAVTDRLAEAHPALAPEIRAAFDHFLCPAFPDCDVKAPPDRRPTTGTPGLGPPPRR